MTQFGDKKNKSKPPSQRQLQVGEEIRHILSLVFMRGDFSHPDVSGLSITVSEVRISPDLKNATAYILPLAGKNKEAVVRALTENSSFLRHLVAKSVRLRQAPKLSFKLDESFDVAGRMNELLNSPTVARDLTSPQEQETE
jgi:ribosome-binding factor A